MINVAEYKRFIGYLLALTLSDGPRREKWAEPDPNRIVSSPVLGRFGMSRTRFEFILHHWRFRVEPTAQQALDPWYQVREFIDDWNQHMIDNYEPSYVITVDESMFFFYGRGMPHL